MNSSNTKWASASFTLKSDCYAAESCFENNILNGMQALLIKEDSHRFIAWNDGT